MRITAYARSMGAPRGAHQKSRGSRRVLPNTMNTMTSPTFEGLNTCEPRKRIRYLVDRENAATPANTHQA